MLGFLFCCFVAFPKVKMASLLAPIPSAVASLVCSENPRRDCNGKREHGLQKCAIRSLLIKKKQNPTLSSWVYYSYNVSFNHL